MINIISGYYSNSIYLATDFIAYTSKMFYDGNIYRFKNYFGNEIVIENNGIKNIKNYNNIVKRFKKYIKLKKYWNLQPSFSTFILKFENEEIDISKTLLKMKELEEKYNTIYIACAFNKKVKNFLKTQFNSITFYNIVTDVNKAFELALKSENRYYLEDFLNSLFGIYDTINESDVINYYYDISKDNFIMHLKQFSSKYKSYYE